MVPLIRHTAVRPPINTKIIRIFRTWDIPSHSMEPVSLAEYPLARQ